MPFISSVRGSYGAQGRFGKKAGILATGGTITTAGGFRIHTFQTGSQSGNTFTFAPNGTGDVEYLIVAGGGGGGAGLGGAGSGGGAGAGGFRTGSLSVTAQNYSVVVGGGGNITQASSGMADGRGTNGGDSSFSGIVSTGGGRGGSGNDVQNRVAGGGGSGGGGAPGNASGNSSAGSGVSGQGSPGSTGFYVATGG